MGAEETMRPTRLLGGENGCWRKMFSRDTEFLTATKHFVSFGELSFESVSQGNGEQKTKSEECEVKLRKPVLQFLSEVSCLVQRELSKYSKHLGWCKKNAEFTGFDNKDGSQDGQKCSEALVGKIQ